ELNSLKKPYTLKPGQQLRLVEDAPIQEPLVDEERISTEIISENTKIKTDSIPSILPASKPKRKLTEAEKELIASVQQEKTVMSQENKTQLEPFSQEKPSSSPNLPENSSKLGEKILPPQDRKSTRLNSSHVKISYAVFCLKK